MSELCARLHELIFRLPEVRWPFDRRSLPRNGIYFFHESGETWGHGDDHPRIVRVGTHREGNFRSRIADHYVLNERKLVFGCDQPAPKDRSIFRKNIGRALLNRAKDSYLATWEIDFTTSGARRLHGGKRDVEREQSIEREVSRILRDSFSFRWIEMEGQAQRMGSHGVEASLIGTVSSCSICRSSSTWLGRSSPKPKIVQHGLWLEQHLGSIPLSDDEALALERAIVCGTSLQLAPRTRS